jgi:hypothetical protein
MNMDELLKEKAEIEAKILAKQKEAEAATTQAHWLKKRLKLVDAQIEATAEVPRETSDGDALKEISEGLK